MKRTFVAIVMGGLAIAGAGIATNAQAASQDDVAPAVARALDKLDTEFARHTRAHRMAEIQWNLDRQRRYGRRGYGPPPGYGYRRGYGPPAGYGYRRGYGPPPGYGYRRDYGPPAGYGQGGDSYPLRGLGAQPNPRLGY